MSSELETTQLENNNNNVDDFGFPFEYLIVKPNNGGYRDLFNYGIRGDVASGIKFLESSQEGYLDQVAFAQRWVIVVSIIARKIIALFRKPMEWNGYFVEFVLNLLSENHNFLGLISNILHGNEAFCLLWYLLVL